MRARLLLASLALPLAACALGSGMATERPPLADMEEPLDLRAEPDDEGERQRLPAGSFSGLVVEDARDTLAAKLGGEPSLRVAGVVENSPAAAAGLEPGDVLLEVRVGDGDPTVLARASEWRQLELATAPGTRVRLTVDRAGREAVTELALVPRVRIAPRAAGERLREEDRVGIVVRTATEVEARAAGLGPGGGAVVIGLSHGSPWRGPGLRFCDLITAVDGRPLAHPQDLLAAIRRPEAERLRLRVRRGEAEVEIDAPLSERDGELTEVWLPPFFDYEAGRGASEWSLLLGFLGYRSTATAWRVRFLWLFGFGGGDADRLEEVGS